MSENIQGMITIIVPVYNVEEYLEKCVTSIIAQKHKNLEIILIDDGSTDRSAKICDEYASIDDRIIVIHQSNAGMSVARNKGLEIAKGEYIGFVDSDDFIDPDMYYVLYGKAAETGSDIVECNFHHTFKNGEDTEIVNKYYDKMSLVCLGREVPWNKLYRHDLIKKTGVRFPPGLYYEDMEFYIKLVPFTEKYAYSDIAPYHYVQRAKSVYHYSTERTRNVFQVLSNIAEYYTKKGLYDEYHDALEFYWARILLCSSLSRICNIPDAASRRALVRENWIALMQRYPKWRKNYILKHQKTKQAIFMRRVNTQSYRIFACVFTIIYKIKRKLSSKLY